MPDSGCVTMIAKYSRLCRRRDRRHRLRTRDVIGKHITPRPHQGNVCLTIRQRLLPALRCQPWGFTSRGKLRTDVLGQRPIRSRRSSPCRAGRDRRRSGARQRRPLSRWFANAMVSNAGQSQKQALFMAEIHCEWRRKLRESKFTELASRQLLKQERGLHALFVVLSRKTLQCNYHWSLQQSGSGCLSNERLDARSTDEASRPHL